MSNQPNPNEQLEKVLKDSDLPSLTKDYAELAIDGLMEDGILKDMPFVGSLISIIKFSNSLNKHFLIKKIYKFLFELNSIPKDKRIKKIDELNNSKKFQSTVGEIIFELLEKIESDYKPEMIGRLFAAVINEKIDFTTYLEIRNIIKNLFYLDLLWFHDCYKDRDYDKKIKIKTSNPLLQSGLLADNILNGNVLFPSSDGLDTETLGKPSQLGIKFLEYCMK